MLIECTLKRDAPVVVPIGNEQYTFEVDDKGRNVCEVWIEDHINAFLAVGHLYREARDADTPPAPPVVVEPAGAPLPDATAAQ